MGLILDLTPRTLERVLYFVNYIVLDPADAQGALEYKQVLTEREYQEAREQYGWNFRVGMGAEAIQELLRAVDLEKEFAERIWYQPNETALTPFPHFQEDFPPIKKILDDYITPEMELTVYEHQDCFDIEYSRLSKGEGLRTLSRITGVSVKDMIAFGDWTNDYSMFEVAGYSVGVNLPDPHRATVNFPTIEEGLRHVLERIKKD
jgi:hydroxymethylpyrimidine pyrophosphatase-like HAD family hydrolase